MLFTNNSNISFIFVSERHIRTQNIAAIAVNHTHTEGYMQVTNINYIPLRNSE